MIKCASRLLIWSCAGNLPLFARIRWARNTTVRFGRFRAFQGVRRRKKARLSTKKLFRVPFWPLVSTLINSSYGSLMLLCLLNNRFPGISMQKIFYPGLFKYFWKKTEWKSLFWASGRLSLQPDTIYVCAQWGVGCRNTTMRWKSGSEDIGRLSSSERSTSDLARRGITRINKAICPSRYCFALFAIKFFIVFIRKCLKINCIKKSLQKQRFICRANKISFAENSSNLRPHAPQTCAPPSAGLLPENVCKFPYIINKKNLYRSRD